MTTWVRCLEDLSADATAEVCGRNASLGEMIRSLKEKNLPVPGGFATTAAAYRAFVEENDLGEKIGSLVAEWQSGDTPLENDLRRRRQRHHPQRGHTP